MTRLPSLISRCLGLTMLAGAVICFAAPDTKPDDKPEAKPEAKPDAGPEVKSQSRRVVLPDVKPGATPDAKPDTKPAAKPAETSDMKPGEVPGETKAGEKGENFVPNHPIPKGGPYALPGEHGTFLRAPYLQCATPDSIYVVWRTLKPMTSPQICVGAAAGTLDMKFGGTAVALRQLAEEGGKDAPIYSAPAGTCQYEARLTGLKPDTKYFYGVFDGAIALTDPDGTYFFHTLPVPGAKRDCLFWIVGDSGTGLRAQKSVHEAMRNWLKEKNLELDGYAHVGDMAYNNGKDLEFTDRFFSIYEATLRHTVTWPAMGNHEGHSSNGTMQLGPYYDSFVCPARGEAGGEASGTEAYYSYDFGRVHFIALDSHDMDRRDNAVMAKWLKQDLDKVRQDKTDWVLTYWHHPPYTKGTHDSDKEVQLVEMRKYIVPILDSHAVDVTFTGHSHIYERSMLIDGAYGTPTTAGKDPVSHLFPVIDDGDGDPERDGAYHKSAGLHEHEGIIHIVTGNGGTKNQQKFGVSPVMRKVSIDHGSVLVQVHGDTLTATMLTYQGKEFDSFQIVKAGRIVPHRVEKPHSLIAQPLAGGPGESLPADALPIIRPNAQWRYLAGTDPDGAGWTQNDFDDSAWKSGPAGFGYSYPDAKTELKDMRGRYQHVYLRTDFALDSVDDADKIGLAVSYDDGLIAYLNGIEVLRLNITGGGSGKNVQGVGRVENAVPPRFFSLAAFKDKFHVGKNVIAIEGHNDSKESHDFLLNPCLLKKR